MIETEYVDLPTPEPDAWHWRLTVADLNAIERLDAKMRAAVERYARQRGWEKPDDDESEADESEAYVRGFEDGVEECQSALYGVHVPVRRRRKGKAK